MQYPNEGLGLTDCFHEEAEQVHEIVQMPSDSWRLTDRYPVRWPCGLLGKKSEQWYFRGASWCTQCRISVGRYQQSRVYAGFTEH